MAEMLRQFVANYMPDSDFAVSNVTKSLSGRSRQNWNFDLIWRSPSGTVIEPLILRRDPDGGLVQTDRAREFSILSSLEGSPVPSPIGRWLDANGTYFGRPALIMRREPGECDYYVVNSDRPVEERLDLARNICDLLVEVHRTDLVSTGLSDLIGQPDDPALAQLVEWEAVLRSDQIEPYPEIDLTLVWLNETKPSPTDIVLVHGDFKPGNILLDHGQITALLDWELAHIGDPAEDLGWVTQPLRKREHMIANVWESDQMLERYEAQSGRQITKTTVRWWQVFATFRTAVMQVSGLKSFIEGRSPEPYRPTARVLEALLDGIQD